MAADCLACLWHRCISMWVCTNIIIYMYIYKGNPFKMKSSLRSKDCSYKDQLCKKREPLNSLKQCKKIRERDQKIVTMFGVAFDHKLLG